MANPNQNPQHQNDPHKGGQQQQQDPNKPGQQNR